MGGEDSAVIGVDDNPCTGGQVRRLVRRARLRCDDERRTERDRQRR
jgi:hypothetical protein